MNQIIQNKKFKIAMIICFIIIAFILSTKPCYAADVLEVIEQAWNSAETQIKNVVNNVVFPIIDLILAVFFFVKLGTAYFDCAPVVVL